MNKKTTSTFLKLLIIISIIQSSVCFSQCKFDNRTLTEIIFQNNTTIFSCTILTSAKDKSGNIYSTARINEIFIGSVNDSVIRISNGNANSKDGQGHLLKVGSKLLYYGHSNSKNFACCDNCDTWSKEINDSNSSKDEIKLLKQFSRIFKKKKSGKYKFYWKDKTLIASGKYKKGIPVDIWNHYNNDGKLKSTINLSKK